MTKMVENKILWLMAVSLLWSTILLAQKTTIYTIGDSTMADKENPDQNPERGWAQMLPLFFSDKVKVDNRAVNGRSTRSFISEGRWDSIHRELRRGDFVFIQFGHNDQKVHDSTRFTNPYTSYRNNLVRFVKESREKGARPVLFTSIVRRNFNEYGVLVDTHSNYPLVVRMVAEHLEVPLVDLQLLTEKLEQSNGVEGSKKLHLHFEAGEHPYYPEGKKDNTHLSELGATQVAELVIKNLKTKRYRLKKYIKE